MLLVLWVNCLSKRMTSLCLCHYEFEVSGESNHVKGQDCRHGVVGT